MNGALKEQVAKHEKDRKQIFAAQAAIDKLREEGVTAATIAELQNNLDHITSSQAYLDRHTELHKLMMADNARRLKDKHRIQACLDKPTAVEGDAAQAGAASSPCIKCGAK